MRRPRRGAAPHHPRQAAATAALNGPQDLLKQRAADYQKRRDEVVALLRDGTSPHGAALDPGVADTLTRNAADTARRQEDLGLPACLLVPDLIRAPLARLLRRAAPRLKVLGHSEIPETHSIRIGSIIGATV